MANRITFRSRKSTRDVPRNGTVRLLDDLLEGSARDGMEATKSVWPVRTGRSRDGFYVERSGRTTRVRNDVGYSGKVHRRGATGEERARGLDETVLPREVQRALQVVLERRGPDVAAAFLAEALREYDGD